jgi:hypothetical protein
MCKIILKSILFVTLFLSLFHLTGCSDELTNKLLLDYKILNQNTTYSGDTIVLSKSSSLQLSLTGEYDFLTFYSGEAGHEYAKRDVKTIGKDDFSSSVLSFEAMPQYGIIPGTLRVFISDSFEGMCLFDKKQDSVLIASHNWIEITDSCNLPVTSAQVKQSSVSIFDYLDKNISVAFLYQTNQNTSAQPTWEIRDLKITNIFVNESVNTIKAVDMGFSALDMYNLNGLSSSSSVWNLNNIASRTNPVMRIQSSPAEASLNQDWLISTPFKINRRLPDTGIAINDITAEYKNFEYSYAEPGVYNACIAASRNNFKNSQEITKELLIKIIN